MEKRKIIQIILAVLVLLGLFYIATRDSEEGAPVSGVDQSASVLNADLPEEESETMATSTPEEVMAPTPTLFDDAPVATPAVISEPVSGADVTIQNTGLGEVTTVAETIMYTDAEILEMLKPLLIEIVKELNRLVVQLTEYRDQVYKERGIPLPTAS